MDFLRRNAKRILIDAAGYGLILAGVLTGWLPGPGGIPLIAAGLGLLSINNAWAKRLRSLILNHAGKATAILFPKNPWAEWGYDLLAILLFALTLFLQVHHANAWQQALGISAFCIAVLIALTNRDRLQRFRSKHKL